MLSSRFAQRLLRYRSEIERDLLLVLETDAYVSGVGLAPFRQGPLHDATERFGVTLFASWANGPKWIDPVEAYPFGTQHVAFAARSRTGGFDVAAAEHWMASTGFGLVRVDAHLFTQARLGNARLLHPHLSVMPADDLQDAIRSAARAAAGPIRWDELAWAGHIAGYQHAECRSAILNFVGNALLCCNLDEPLTPETWLLWYGTANGIRHARERQARSRRRRDQRRRTSG